jgi:hypothetical protein
MDAHKTQTGKSCAPTGSAHQDASRRPTTPSTNARDAEKEITEPKRALEHRRHEALTPYQPEEWEWWLQEAGMEEEARFMG